jgi:hypothetical protein
MKLEQFRLFGRIAAGLEGDRNCGLGYRLKIKPRLFYKKRGFSCFGQFVLIFFGQVLEVGKGG